MILRAKKMALFDFNVTTCKTTQKWQKEGHITTPVPVDPKLSVKYYLSKSARLCPVHLKRM